MADKEVVHDPANSPAFSESDNEIVGEKINERSLLRKIDARLLPAVGILYLLSFLDRSNGIFLLLCRRSNSSLTMFARSR